MTNRKTHSYDSRESLVQVGKVAGATSVSRRCDNGESLVRLGKVTGASETSRWCDFGAAQGADEKSSRKSAHIGKLRKSLENRAECLERKYDPNQCGNYEGYIASCLAKFAGCDAARAKDQQSACGEVSLDEPVNGEDAGGGSSASAEVGE